MKKLFLKWCVINVASTLLLFYIAVSSWQIISSLALAGKAVLAVIATVYTIANIYAGILSWRQTGETVARAEAVGFAAHECPFIGLLGAVAGIIASLSGTVGGGSTESQFGMEAARAMSGIGVAFLPTFFGIYCRIVLWWIYNLLITYEGRDN